MLNRLFLAPLLALSLAACASHTSVVSTPAVPHLAPATKVAAMQTLSDKSWSITLPSDFVRSSADDGMFDAINAERSMAIFIEIAAFDGDIEMGAQQLVMALASHGIDIDSVKPGTMSGMDAIVLQATKEYPAGLAHFKSYAVFVKGHAYNLGCVIRPPADLDASIKICDAAAASVKITPLPAVAGSSDDGTSLKANTDN